MQEPLVGLIVAADLEVDEKSSLEQESGVPRGALEEGEAGSESCEAETLGESVWRGC